MIYGRDYFGNRRFTLSRAMRRLLRMCYVAFSEVVLGLRVQFGRTSLTAPGSTVVSLTSHGERLKKVHLAIESIGWGYDRPARIVLWLDPGVDVAAANPKIARLVRRGLDVRNAPHRMGPHTKYYPYVESLGSANIPAETLVTADDDVIYPRYWLAVLTAGASADRVRCFRAHRLRVSRTGIASYREWTPVKDSEPSLLNFATGVMGVLCPPAFVDKLRDAGDAFKETCPTADDVWLHAVAVRNNFPIEQVFATRREFPNLFGSQRGSLVSANAFGGGNDPQIQATYTDADVARLREVVEEARDKRGSGAR